VTRVLGLDMGQRRIGLALSDSLGLTAGPLGVLPNTGTQGTIKAIEAIVNKHQVNAIVVGLPLTLKGSRGSQAQKVESFTRELGKTVSLPIFLVDERLTTVQGERALREIRAPRKRRDEVIDQVAAQLILQSYLDSQNPNDASNYA